MKAIILAAGKGKRFGDITKIIPKPLIKLGEFSLIEHNIILLKKYGFEEIIINVSHLSGLIIDSLGNGEKYNVNINYSIEHPEPLETGGGIQNALGLLGDEPFLTINSDIYTDCNLSKININASDLASLVMVKNPPHNKQGDFSILNNRVVLKKRDNVTYSGIGIYRPEFFQNNILKKYKLIDLLIKHIKNNKVSGSHFKGIWYDIGNEERLTEVKNLFFKN
tara:strand:- start:1408 stop:2073 length:666 start_codon:yes stop_codon:yes gene_type:complete